MLDQQRRSCSLDIQHHGGVGLFLILLIIVEQNLLAAHDHILQIFVKEKDNERKTDAVLKGRTFHKKWQRGGVPECTTPTCFFHPYRLILARLGMDSHPSNLDSAKQSRQVDKIKPVYTVSETLLQKETNQKDSHAVLESE